MKIGVIGYGGRMRGLLSMVEKFNTGAKIQAIADPNFEAIAARRAASGDKVPECAVYSDADRMLESEKLDAVMIGTRCSLHAKMAMKVLPKGLPLYLEKPIATNRKDLLALAAAGKKAKGAVVVSFPLKVSPVVTLVKEIIESGKIGTVETMDAWNDPPYGAVYFREWYRDECETGGLWLQKATHDFDYLTFLAGAHPKRIAAMTSKRVFTGKRPAGLKCKDCKEWETCLESPFHLYYSRGMTKDVAANEFYCMFAKDTGNEDAGHALVEFENGVQLAYSQVFMARRTAGRRGARIYGYLGTIEFDWFTDEVKVMLNHSPRVETYSVGSKELPHHGGDNILIWNFLQLAARKAKKSVSPLSEGVISVNLCLAAGESAKTGTFKNIKPI
jgi:predicted dehydrogenase